MENVKFKGRRSTEMLASYLRKQETPDVAIILLPHNWQMYSLLEKPATY